MRAPNLHTTDTSAATRLIPANVAVVGPDNPSRYHRAQALEAVSRERARQIAEHVDHHHLPDGTGGTLRRLAADEIREETDRAAADGRLTWRHILAEEVAEADAESDPLALRAELVKLAAMAVAWIEALDRRVA